MNILLLSMPDVDVGYHPAFVQPPNLGLSSLAGNLDRRHTATIADLVLRRKNVRAAIHESLEVSRPEIVGLSALTYQYDSAVRTAKLIKEVNPRIRIALGGYHATLMYQEIARSEAARYLDLIFRGEADLSFNEAVDCYETGKKLDSVRGLSFKKDGQFLHNPPRPLEDLKAIALPNRVVRLWQGYHILGLPFDLAETSRGCLMLCKFCSIRQMYGRSFRRYEMSRVMADLVQAKRNGTRAIFFTDDNITLDAKHLEGLCDAILRNGHDDLMYGIQASPAGLSSRPLVEKMARAGFKLVFLGIENKLSRNLRQWQKGHSPNQTGTAVRLLREQGIRISGGLIIGHPDDSRQDIDENFRYLKGLEVNYAAVQFLTPYPKTDTRAELKAGGFIANEFDFKRYVGHRANIRTKHMNEHQLTRLKYQLSRKYFKSRNLYHFRVLITNLGSFLKILHLRAVPRLAKFAFVAYAEKLGDALLTERQRYLKYLSLNERLNKFNI